MQALGCVPAVPGYFPAMKAVCDKYGALLVLDEVMSGMGRCGTLHAWEQEGVVPDIQTVGKGLGGGYAPVSAVLIGKRVARVMENGTGAFRHGQTYQGHPLGCAAALAVQREIQERNLLANVRVMGALLEEKLKDYIGGHPNVGDIRGRGLFWGVSSFPSSVQLHGIYWLTGFSLQIEFVKDKRTKEPFDPKLGVSTRVQNLALSPKYSFSIYAGTGTVDGKRGDHVLLAPPYTVNKNEVEQIARLTTAVIEEVFANLPTLA